MGTFALYCTVFILSSATSRSFHPISVHINDVSPEHSNDPQYVQIVDETKELFASLIIFINDSYVNVSDSEMTINPSTNCQFIQYNLSSISPLTLSFNIIASNHSSKALQTEICVSLSSTHRPLISQMSINLNNISNENYNLNDSIFDILSRSDLTVLPRSVSLTESDKISIISSMNNARASAA